MKKALFTTMLMAAGAFTVFGIFSFIKPEITSTSNIQANRMALSKSEPVTFFTHATGTTGDGSTYTGTVVASGGINTSGTYIMPTKVLGMALHCLVTFDLPDGTITIRMNCNMKTLNGRWKVLEGTGAYEDLEGVGSLVMPNDFDEILTGHVSWK